MPIEGEYEASPWDWVREQVDRYERSGGRDANTFLDTGLPVITLTTRANNSGKVRKTALMRVEHDGERARWWDRAVAAYPPYAEYRANTTRVIPVFLATRR